MGVIYKLTDEVVQFIVSQRQNNPLASCRQLAESASEKFGLHLSKSSVHDVLKESGIITPRGRKPKDKFKIPQEKKNQIQVSLSQVKLLPDPVIAPPATLIEAPIETAPTELGVTDEISPAYEGAGKIFLKAALWDLGIFSEGNIKETDWEYYLTYAKGVKVDVENNQNLFIELPLPIERCIRTVADGLINNINTLIVDKVSEENLFKACMEAKAGSKIKNIAIVDKNDHILVELSDIVEINRNYKIKNIIFVESKERNVWDRSKSLFFSQHIVDISVIEKMVNLKGFDTINKDENIVTLLINDSDDHKTMVQEAADKLNGMWLRDEEGRLVSVILKSTLSS